jgi:hypothetical protein
MEVSYFFYYRIKFKNIKASRGGRGGDRGRSDRGGSS